MEPRNYRNKMYLTALLASSLLILAGPASALGLGVSLDISLGSDNESDSSSSGSASASAYSDYDNADASANASGYVSADQLVSQLPSTRIGADAPEITLEPICATLAAADAKLDDARNDSETAIAMADTSVAQVVPQAVYADAEALATTPAGTASGGAAGQLVAPSLPQASDALADVPVATASAGEACEMADATVDDAEQQLAAFGQNETADHEPREEPTGGILASIERFLDRVFGLF